MNKLELVKSFQMEQENENVAAYKKMFPQARPNLYQLDLIEGTITDLKAWQRTLEFWASNDYRPQSIGRMLDYYRQLQSGTVQTFEDASKAKMRIGEQVQTPYVPPPPCRFCGSDVCLQSHIEEIRAEDMRKSA